MIVDVPTADDFNASGTDFLNIAWETIVDLSLDLEIRQKLWIGDKDLQFSWLNLEEVDSDRLRFS